MPSNLSIHREEIHGNSLRNNALEDPENRDVILIEHNCRDDTPILVGLAGFFGTAQSFLNRSYTNMDFLSTLEMIIRNDPDLSFVIALPDTMTGLHGNQYLNSGAVGNYEDFITEDVTGFLEKRYGRRKMGIFGKSSGGFGAYNLASLYPAIFSGFIDVSGDSAFEFCYLKDFPVAYKTVRKYNTGKFIDHFSQSPSHTSDELNTMNLIAMSAFYSPEEDEDSGIGLPFRVDTGLIREDIWKKWLKFDPVRNVKSRLESLGGQTAIFQVGNHDEFSLNLGIEALSSILNENGIQNTLMRYDEGHFGIDYFYGDSIPMLIRGISQEPEVNR
ncbi:MAG: alpha/beta hydrolase-fold protein [Thermoplasmataceae archaeon]